MSLTPEQRAELLELADRHVEDRLDEPGRARLEEMVGGNREAAELFVRFSGFASLLERRERTAASPFDVSPEEFETDTWLRTAYLYMSQPFQISLIIAGLAVTIGLLSLALARVEFGPRDGGAEVAARPNFVGRFTRLADCRWSSDTLARFDGSPAAQDDVEARQLLELLAGEFDLLLDSGARLRVAGPATLRCTGDNEIEFLHGQLTAYAPQRAVGFTVHVAGAKLVDLGTEFGLQVDPLGSAEAHVYQGEVTVELDAAAGEPIHLRSNQAVRWKRGKRDSAVQFASNPAQFRRWSPGVEVPSLFIAESANAEPQSALPFEPASDDLLEGLVPTVVVLGAADEELLKKLTDGFGSDPLHQGRDGRVILDSVADVSYAVVYDLNLPAGEAAVIEQLRVFTYNTDSRVFVDCDLEGSLDGDHWFPLHQRLTNGRRGVDFNLPSGTQTDYYFDYAVAWLTRRGDVPPVRHIRLTFRGPWGVHEFSATPSLRHSAITEIDLTGDIKVSPGAD